MLTLAHPPRLRAPHPQRRRKTNKTLFTAITIAAVIGALLVTIPFTGPLVLAAWFAHITTPMRWKLARWLGGRTRAAVAVAALVSMGFLLPVALSVFTVATGMDEIEQLIEGDGGGKAVVAGIFSNGRSRHLSLDLIRKANVVELVKQYGEAAWKTMGSVAELSAAIIIATFVFVWALVAFGTHGEEITAWLRRRIPIKREAFDRFSTAFHETGRGLLVGIGLTAVAQGAVATMLYFFLGVPRSVLFGVLTTAAALIPTVGTALVWVPIAVGLAMTGAIGKALLMLATGMLVISTIDNILRPMLARCGQLQLPGLVLFTSMLGGLAVFGAWGLIYGPLLVRLAVEALDIRRQENAHAPRTPRVLVQRH